MPEQVRAFDSSSKEYHEAFQVFLGHTNEKAKIKDHPDGIIASLPSRQTLIDVGAGNGALTAHTRPSTSNLITPLRTQMAMYLSAATLWPYRLMQGAGPFENRSWLRTIVLRITLADRIDYPSSKP